MDAPVRTLFSDFLGGRLRTVLLNVRDPLSGLEAVRIRIGQPLSVKLRSGTCFVAADGGLFPAEARAFAQKGYKPDAQDIAQTIAVMSDYSLYAFEEEIRHGFITIPGGHRVGLCGQAVLAGGAVKTINHISGLHIRLTRQIKGCGERLIAAVANPDLKHTMIISPPGCGKTTLLRDLARLLSDGDAAQGRPGYTVGIVDERSEIAACYRGVPQNDVGIRTDVLDAAPKAAGMHMLLRSMSPDIIVVDEVGRREDVSAIDEIVHSGVKVICTAHGASIEDIRKKDGLSGWMQKQLFDLFIVLRYGKSPGEIAGVFDAAYKEL